MSGHFFIRNVATGRVLDSKGDGTVYTNGQNFGDYQKFNVSQSGQGWATLQNVATGNFLDSSH